MHGVESRTHGLNWSTDREGMMHRTYDDWKTTDPNDDMRDYCSRCHAPTSGNKLWLLNCAWLCDECRGEVDEEEDEEEDDE